MEPVREKGRKKLDVIGRRFVGILLLKFVETIGDTLLDIQAG